MKIDVHQTNFIAGQFDDVARSRVETQMLANGAAELRNCLPLATGGMLTRWGSKHLAFLGDGTIGQDPAVRLVEFEFSRSQGYIFAFMHQRVLIFDGTTGDYLMPIAGQLWTEAMLPSLRFAQLGDVMWVTCADMFTPVEIIRTGYAAFYARYLPFDSTEGRPFFRYASSSIGLTVGGATVATQLTLAALPTYGGVSFIPFVGLRGRTRLSPAGVWQSFTVSGYPSPLVVSIVWDTPTSGYAASLAMDVEFAVISLPPVPPPPATGSDEASGGGGDGGGGGGGGGGGE